MGTDGKFDEYKGKSKKAVGDFTEDDELRKEGRKDEAAGKTKQGIDKLKDKASDAVDSLRDKS